MVKVRDHKCVISIFFKLTFYDAIVNSRCVCVSLPPVNLTATIPGMFTEQPV